MSKASESSVKTTADPCFIAAKRYNSISFHFISFQDVQIYFIFICESISFCHLKRLPTRADTLSSEEPSRRSSHVYKTCTRKYSTRSPALMISLACCASSAAPGTKTLALSSSPPSPSQRSPFQPRTASRSYPGCTRLSSRS